MERVLRIRYELLRSLRMRYVLLQIVTECTDRCGWALRIIRRVRKCVCDWGINDASTLVGHKRQPVSYEQGMDGKSKNLKQIKKNILSIFIFKASL